MPGWIVHPMSNLILIWASAGQPVAPARALLGPSALHPCMVYLGDILIPVDTRFNSIKKPSVHLSATCRCHGSPGLGKIVFSSLGSLRKLASCVWWGCDSWIRPHLTPIFFSTGPPQPPPLSQSLFPRMKYPKKFPHPSYHMQPPLSPLL